MQPLHTLRFETPAPYTHPTVMWARARADHRERCWQALVSRTAGMEATRPLFAFADTPRDIEARFRTTRNGSVRQGALIREQTFTNRPHPDCHHHHPNPGHVPRRRRGAPRRTGQPGWRLPRKARESGALPSSLLPAKRDASATVPAQGRARAERVGIM